MIKSSYNQRKKHNYFSELISHILFILFFIARFSKFDLFAFLYSITNTCVLIRILFLLRN